MKRIKLMLSAVGIFAVVGTALAFTAQPYGSGSVYCNSTCTDRVDYRVAAVGVADVCNGQEYVKNVGSPTNCITATGPFEAIAAER